MWWSICLRTAVPACMAPTAGLSLFTCLFCCVLLLQMPLDDIQSLMEETAEAKEYQVSWLAVPVPEPVRALRAA